MMKLLLSLFTLSIFSNHVGAWELVKHLKENILELNNNYDENALISNITVGASQVKIAYKNPKSEATQKISELIANFDYKLIVSTSYEISFLLNKAENTRARLCYFLNELKGIDPYLEQTDALKAQIENSEFDIFQNHEKADTTWMIIENITQGNILELRQKNCQSTGIKHIRVGSTNIWVEFMESHKERALLKDFQGSYRMEQKLTGLVYGVGYNFARYEPNELLPAPYFVIGSNPEGLARVCYFIHRLKDIDTSLTDAVLDNMNEQIKKYYKEVPQFTTQDQSKYLLGKEIFSFINGVVVQ